MKTVLLLFAFLASPAHAALPDCWTTNGSAIGYNRAGQEIADGQWLVLVRFQKATKDDLVWLLGALSQGNLRATTYPSVFGTDFAVFLTQAVDDTGRLPRNLLQARVNTQLARIQARPGVESLECNGIAHPGH